MHSPTSGSSPRAHWRPGAHVQAAKPGLAEAAPGADAVVVRAALGRRTPLVRYASLRDGEDVGAAPLEIGVEVRRHGNLDGIDDVRLGLDAEQMKAGEAPALMTAGTRQRVEASQ